MAATAAAVTLSVSEYPVEHYYPAGANFPVGRSSVTINYPVSAHSQLAPHATQISYNSQVDSSSNVLYPEPQLQVTLNIYQLFNEYYDKYFFLYAVGHQNARSNPLKICYIIKMKRFIFCI